MRKILEFPRHAPHCCTSQTSFLYIPFLWIQVISSMDTENDKLQKFFQLTEAWWLSWLKWWTSHHEFETWNLTLNILNVISPHSGVWVSVIRCCGYLALDWHPIWFGVATVLPKSTLFRGTKRLGLSYLRELHYTNTLSCSIQKTSVAQQARLTPKWDTSSVCSLKLSPAGCG